MSGDRVTTGMDAVVVRVVADDGTIGIGESGTVGVTFDAQHLPGQLAGVTVLASAILGADPRSPQSVHRRMTAAMTGHPYAKAPARRRRLGPGRPRRWRAAVATVGW